MARNGVFALIIISSFLVLALNSNAAEVAPFSGCRGSGWVKRCCTDDFAPDQKKSRFEEIEDYTRFGKHCLKKGGTVVSSGKSCTIRLHSGIVIPEQTEIVCQIGNKEKSPAPKASKSKDKVVKQDKKEEKQKPKDERAGCENPNGVSPIGINQDLGKAINQLPGARSAKYLPKAAGVYSLSNFDTLFKQYPGLKSNLTYLKIDGNFDSWFSDFKGQRNIADFNMIEYSPQVALELDKMNLSEFIAAMKSPNSTVRQNIKLMAQEFKDYGKRVYLRPLSEMNDNTGSWSFGGKKNTPEQYAEAWKLLHDAVMSEGADNVLFNFNVLAATMDGKQEKVKRALDLIPPGMIDSIGMTVYSRTYKYYGKSGSGYVPFSNLVEPWLKLAASSKHKDLPWTVGEMSADQSGTDEEKAKWIHDAYAYARSKNFAMVTYFNVNGSTESSVPGATNYSVAPNSLAEAALKEEIAKFSN